MAFYTPRERHIVDLHAAFRTESIDRRTFFKVAGAAAGARGPSHKPFCGILAGFSNTQPHEYSSSASSKRGLIEFSKATRSMMAGAGVISVLGKYSCQVPRIPPAWRK